MNFICIPAFNRPDELQRTLQSIPRNKNWNVYLAVEHNAPKEVLQVVDQFRSRLDIICWKNGFQFGSRLNTFAVCQRAIEQGSEAVLSMDDDITLSPDALDLCEWYLRRRDFLNPETNAGLALCRKDANDPNQPVRINKNDTWMGHLGQGHFFTREMWFNFVARSFWVYESSHRGGADWAVCAEAVKTGRTLLRPQLARARHAGAVGYHGPGIGVFPAVISDGTCRDYQIE